MPRFETELMESQSSESCRLLQTVFCDVKMSQCTNLRLFSTIIEILKCYFLFIDYCFHKVFILIQEYLTDHVEILCLLICS